MPGIGCCSEGREIGIDKGMGIVKRRICYILEEVAVVSISCVPSELLYCLC
jgi:hypothetical protein